MERLRDWLYGLSDAQLNRFYERVWQRLTDGNGYQPYGYDWPTLFATRPGLASVLAAVQTEGRNRANGN